MNILNRSKIVQPTRGWTVAASTQHKLYSLLLPPAMGARFYRFRSGLPPIIREEWVDNNNNILNYSIFLCTQSIIITVHKYIIISSYKSLKRLNSEIKSGFARKSEKFPVAFLTPSLRLSKLVT